MARNTHGTYSELIHCDNCDEDYSATYKRCPFCGARPDKTAYTQPINRSELTSRIGAGAEESQRSRSRAAVQEEDDYVFDGQGVFDDVDDYDDDGYDTRRGGKRLAGGDGTGITPTTIIGIIFSAAVVIAALLIVFLVIIPMVQGGRTPTAENDPNSSISGLPSSPGQSASGNPGADITDDPALPTGGDPDSSNDPEDPSITDSPDPDPTGSTPASPSVSPSVSPSPSTGGFTLSHSDFTISDRYPDPVQLRASGATGSVTWTSSNPSAITVSANGLVTAVGKGNATITATDSAGHTQTCKVISSITGGAAEPSPSAEPSVSPSVEPSAEPSSSPSAEPSGTLTLTAFGRAVEDFTISASGSNSGPVRLRASGASGDVTWTSSNTAVATVSADGTVTRVAKGSCTITATDANGNTGSCLVRCG